MLPVTLPFRNRQPDHQAEGITKQRQREAWRDRMPVASRRTAQLLLPRGCMIHAGTLFGHHGFLATSARSRPWVEPPQAVVIRARDGVSLPLSYARRRSPGMHRRHVRGMRKPRRAIGFHDGTRWFRGRIRRDPKHGIEWAKHFGRPAFERRVVGRLI